MGPFIQKWVFNPRTGEVDLEIDEVRAQYPMNPSLGYAYLSTTEYQSILAVPSAHRFLMRQMWVFNNTGLVNILQFYDGSGVSVTMGGIPVAASDAQFIDLGNGFPFRSNVCVSNLASNVQLRVGGILLKSGPE